MSLSSEFHMSPDVAAETGIHIGDGGLSIKRGGPHGSYLYEVTGHALEDQLYLIGTVMPTISAAYDLQRPGLYINPEQTWISLRYQSKAVALFKHETLGLPNGRKRNLSIPESLSSDPRLMRLLGRELLATDGLLGFYSANQGGAHKYPRIQFKMNAGHVIDQLSNFLRNELGISFLRRTERVAHNGWGVSHQQILQISRSDDIDTWRREIGFSNPSHISRMMIFESLGECIPRTSIVDRLSFLSGRTSRFETSGPITPYDLLSVVDKMRRNFGFPQIRGEAILQKMREINRHLQSGLGRGLPVLVDS
ncbi:MAG TPA: hypothetical protein VGS11_02405 [Candidatus Bathyarchaeia archaeon]|nr:hypothetical protein [Candidatus Bathyarchaeia archaeon]